MVLTSGSLYQAMVQEENIGSWHGCRPCSHACPHADVLLPAAGVQGKAAIDVVCNPLGKSGGSAIQQLMIIGFGSLAASTPYLGAILLAVVLAWLAAASSLNKQARHRVLQPLLPWLRVSGGCAGMLAGMKVFTAVRAAASACSTGNMLAEGVSHVRSDPACCGASAGRQSACRAQCPAMLASAWQDRWAAGGGRFSAEHSCICIGR